ncbi:MAG: tetratricopeptide repeat protein [Fimbriimonadaceae bacterium]|nr:tetratricopeptide repeat protein [Fimbriimonadaceae bacterium]
MSVANLPDLDSLWTFENPKASEQRFRDLIAEFEPGMDEPSVSDFVLEAKTQLARSIGLQRRYDEAHKVLDEVEPHATEDRPRLRVRYLLERGRVFNSSGKKQESHSIFMHAWGLASSVSGIDGLAVDAAHMLGIVEPGDKGLEWNERALELASKSPDPKAQKWMASLYNNIGWTYFEREEYGLALDSFHKAVPLRREEGNAMKLRHARYAVAKTLRFLGDYTTALQMARDLAAEDETDGYAHEEIGENMVALGMSGASKPHFKAAYKILSQDEYIFYNEFERLTHLKQQAAIE